MKDDFVFLIGKIRERAEYGLKITAGEAGADTFQRILELATEAESQAILDVLERSLALVERSR